MKHGASLLLVVHVSVILGYRCIKKWVGSISPKDVAKGLINLSVMNVQELQETAPMNELWCLTVVSRLDLTQRCC